MPYRIQNTRQGVLDPIKYTGAQKELIMLRFMLLSAYIGRQEAHRTPTAFRVIVMNFFR